jgi:hypothetical protein
MTDFLDVAGIDVAGISERRKAHTVGVFLVGEGTEAEPPTVWAIFCGDYRSKILSPYMREK